MKRNPIAFLSVAVGFFALYALTAQRGLGWGDSGEFHYRILSDAAGAFSGCESFATAHPLYVALAKALCSTPFQVTLLSSFFGALAVCGFLLCSRNLALTVAFGVAHAVWWLSCVAEVYTMSLCFLALETWCMLRYRGDRRSGWLILLFFLNGFHLELHNLALLSLPVYAALLLLHRRTTRSVPWLGTLVAAACAWALGAAFWLQALWTRGAADVLVGGYGGEVCGLLPKNGVVTAFNLALTSLSFFAPLAVLWWNRRNRDVRPAGDAPTLGWPVVALFVLHFLFFVRYFIVSQYTFALPSVFFAYLLVSRFRIGRERALALVAMQVLLPVLAYHVLSSVKVPAWRSSHPYRDEAAYFAFPWKFNDDSADRCAAQFEGAWKGYWDCSGKERGL